MKHLNYKVDNAIIMAAGMSSRFAPLSYEIPKGLLVVKGEVLIERQIRQLHEAGIDDITVVVGFMKEKFRYLRRTFGVSIVDNDDYSRYNNTSTMIRVLDRLRNTYICSSDNYFAKNVFEAEVPYAYYAATYFPGRANEWGLKFNDDDLITDICHSPVDMWCMMGHVFFDNEFSSRFKDILIDEYAHELTRGELWESVYERHIGELKMYIRKYHDDVILEFDSLDDLRKFDIKYLEDSGSAVLAGVCRQLGCRERDIGDIEVVRGVADALSFRFKCYDLEYIYSHKTKKLRKVTHEDCDKVCL